MIPRGTARRTAQAIVVALAGVWLAGCFGPRQPPAPTPSPHEACRALLESLAAAVPPGESLAELEARGIRLRTPLNFPPGTSPNPTQPSGAAVRLLITPDGTVMPGSPKTLKSIGETQLAQAMEAAALSMDFVFDAGAQPTAPVPFTATHAVCVRS
ncbi:hypothetical protein [Piscinibacter sp.]|uniref:hypothetical protein n=1 Tax=Piscinibacter sp. TaxID=1903157 RepID=UPI002C113884|nr:hypothetical protein [Albitalea sp.]HUG21578.1 hypothetical protein [Albitalea sp.]